MDTYIGASPYDTNISCEIVSEINELEALQRQLSRLITSKTEILFRRYREELLAQRPTYPTPGQRALIKGIAKSVHAGDSTDSFSSGSVSFSAGLNIINIYTQAPYDPQTSRRLWEFQDEEIDAVRALLRKNGLRILDEKTHVDGHSFLVASKRV